MMGLLFLIGIAAFVAFPGSAAAATPDSALPCHEAIATTMDHHGGAIDHAPQGSKAHQSGSCCSIASCHAAMETMLPDVYAPIPVAGRIAGRSEERRVGKGVCRTCNSRWSPVSKKK